MNTTTTGALSAIELAPDDALDLVPLVDAWIASRFGGELCRDGDLTPLEGAYYATIRTDWRPIDSVIVWEAGGFYVKGAAE